MIAGYCFGQLNRVSREDVLKLDVINIAFGLVVKGKLFYPMWKTAAAEAERWRKIKPELRVTLSVGGWGAGGFSRMCASPEGIAAFTDSCMDMIERMRLDGLDIDWEYPTCDWAGIDASSDDCKNFTALVASLRGAMDARFTEHKLLTVAVCGNVIKGSMEFGAIHPYLDYISLMTYDMASGNTARHHTALNPTAVNGSSAKSAVEQYAAVGVPREKMVIGAAFYARCWKDISADDKHPHGLGGRCARPKSKANFGRSYNDLRRFCLDDEGNGKNGWVVGRDNGAPYLYHPKKKIFVSFDDEESVREKVRFAKEAGLLGVMYWEHRNDKSRRLLTAMREAEK